MAKVILCICLWLQQSKAKYETEAEKRELSRLLEKKTHEAENLTGERLVQKNKTPFFELYSNVVNYHSVLFKYCSVVCSRVSLLHVEPFLHSNNTTLISWCLDLTPDLVLDVWFFTLEVSNLRSMAYWTMYSNLSSCLAISRPPCSCLFM